MERASRTYRVLDPTDCRRTFDGMGGQQRGTMAGYTGNGNTPTQDIPGTERMM
ncbi:MAG: hypothetical protein PHV74_15000 [Dehalococcoidia bacterium]|jgi:hypothetical protein|nr:hypothetical protein [Dehalococcoidia bacterium]